MKTLERILLVDDDEITNFINESLITKAKFALNIITNTNAKNALSYLEKECSESNLYPNLILLDLKMPGMDGFEFLKEFQKLSEKVKERIVIVILSTSQASDDILRLKSLGNYYLLNKPLTLEKLNDVNQRFFQNKQPDFTSGIPYKPELQ